MRSVKLSDQVIVFNNLIKNSNYIPKKGDSSFNYDSDKPYYYII